MTKGNRVAVLEDNLALCEELVLFLEDEGFVAEGFSHAASFMAAHRLQPFGTILLDLGLPDKDGIAVADELSKSRDDIGIIILSARDTVGDRIRGLSVGADAYLVKPFEFDELLAHINALTRRKSLYLSAGEWVLDEQQKVLRYSENHTQSVLLAAQEVSILKALADQYPDFVTRNEMILALGEDYRVYDERRLEKVISRLRKKLSEKWGLAPIKAVRNKGYVYAAPIRILS